ncbi:MAG: hypothetical protein EOM78_22550, partial [Erysipelotrichia bacterium]|nr:hypothetical protein [Erysipelotrichia bacterium]
MEKNVYKAGNINKKAYDEFTKNKIDVIWSDSSDYSLNHSKFFIIDDETIINFSKKIKNAYAQRNFKASRKNTKDKSKKTVIATLTPELQKKLSDLSQASEMTRQEMLELCIN